MAMTLGELAERIGGRLGAGEPGHVVRGCNRLEDAGPDEVAFLANPRYKSQLQTTRAGAVIVSPGVQADGRALLVAEDPYLAFRDAVVALHGFRRHPEPADGPVSSFAAVDPTASVGEGTRVHPFAVLGPGAQVGRNCVIYPHSYIGPDTRVGDECQIYPNVVIYEGCVLGNRVNLHSGTVVGQDGFGYAPDPEGRHRKIPQVGNVVIEDDVEMGAGCAIDRATVGSTRIGRGTKFSDLVAVGHGTQVGEDNLLVALVALAGAVWTGKHLAMGGQVGVAGHVRIGDRVQIAATSGVMEDVPDDSQVGGTPARPLGEAKRMHLHMERLPQLASRVKQLERELEAIKNGRSEE